MSVYLALLGWSLKSSVEQATRSIHRSSVSNIVVEKVVRESALVGIVIALLLAFTVQIRRGERAPAMLAYLAAPPPPDVTSKAMPIPSFMSEIDTTVQELRLEQHHHAFTHKLAHVVSAIGAIPDSPPQGFPADAMVRLRELAEETVEAIERRIDSGGDGETVQPQLAGTVYEIRRRMEAVETWFRHFANEP